MENSGKIKNEKLKIMEGIQLSQHKIQYYTLNQVCKMFQISESTARRMLRDGTMPRFKYCGKVLVPAWFVEQGSIKPLDDQENDGQKFDN